MNLHVMTDSQVREKLSVRTGFSLALRLTRRLMLCLASCRVSVYLSLAIVRLWTLVSSSGPSSSIPILTLPILERLQYVPASSLLDSTSQLARMKPDVNRFD
jgi:hypothetical protein